MKITVLENENNKTHWEHINIGVVFHDGHNYFMKVEETYDEDNEHINAVNLATGELVGFMPDCRVKIVDAHLMVKEK